MNDETPNRRILIIDDMESIHQDFRKTLLSDMPEPELEGDEALLFGKKTAIRKQLKPIYTLDSALQGEAGFAKVREAVREGRPYAMAFVDMRMPPGWDGVQTIKKLWSEDPGLQIVICTAHSDYSWEQIIEQIGGNDQLLILKKPFDYAEVCQLANALTEKWHLSRRARLKVEELEKMVEQRTRELLQAAEHDRLTGLPNRANITRQITNALVRSHAEGSHYALLFLDFDRFKVINDSLGHQVGDQLLVGISHRLTQSLHAFAQLHPGATTQPARLGGDEFLVLAEGLADSAAAANLAQFVLRQLNAPFNLAANDVCITASIGVTTSDIGYQSAEDLIRDADNAMYRAKTSGRDRFVLFDSSMLEAAMSRLQIEQDLRRAVDRGELVLHYQPIVNIETGEIVGLEALTRWRREAGRLVMPDAFIPVAEETGLICRIGRWGMEAACRQLMAWRTRIPAAATWYMSVNLSKRQFLDAGLVQDIAETLARTGLPPSSLYLELTESVIMHDPELIIPLLHQLKGMGIRLSMDDFGTGHSSLTLLSRFPINMLKIDKAFIKNMEGHRDYAAIVQAIVTLASNMNMMVTAEGVETLDQLVQIQAFDCDAAQGYFFSRPMDEKVCTEFISHRPYSWHPLPGSSSYRRISQAVTSAEMTPSA